MNNEREVDSSLKFFTTPNKYEIQNKKDMLILKRVFIFLPIYATVYFLAIVIFGK